jgi:hypothetical protein
LSKFSNARFPIGIWNQHNEVLQGAPKTNNAIEGWHNTLNNTFNNSYFNPNLLISSIKDEEENTIQKKFRTEFGEQFKRKRKYVLMERRVREYFLTVEEHYGVDFVFNLVDLIFY